MNSFVNVTAKLLNIITNTAAVLAAIGLSMIVCSYVYEVITRYVFNLPTAWASDFVSYGLCATVFLALPKVTKDKAHVAISLLGFFVLALSAWISLQENIRQFTRGIETLAIVPIPQWWVSSFITFGFAVSAGYLLLYVSPSHRVDGSAGE